MIQFYGAARNGMVWGLGITPDDARKDARRELMTLVDLSMAYRRLARAVEDFEVFELSFEEMRRIAKGTKKVPPGARRIV